MRWCCCCDMTKCNKVQGIWVRLLSATTRCTCWKDVGVVSRLHMLQTWQPLSTNTKTMSPPVAKTEYGSLPNSKRQLLLIAIISVFHYFNNNRPNKATLNDGGFYHICSFQYQQIVGVDIKNQPVEVFIATTEKQRYFPKHVSSELSLKHFCLIHYDLRKFARDLFGCPKPSTQVCVYPPLASCEYVFILIDWYSIIADRRSITVTNVHNRSRPEVGIGPCRCFLGSLEPSKGAQAAAQKPKLIWSQSGRSAETAERNTDSDFILKCRWV